MSKVGLAYKLLQRQWLRCNTTGW